MWIFSFYVLTAAASFYTSWYCFDYWIFVSVFIPASYKCADECVSCLKLCELSLYFHRCRTRSTSVPACCRMSLPTIIMHWTCRCIRTSRHRSDVIPTSWSIACCQLHSVSHWLLTYLFTYLRMCCCTCVLLSVHQASVCVLAASAAVWGQKN